MIASIKTGRGLTYFACQKRIGLGFSINEGGRWFNIHLHLWPTFYFYVFLFGSRFALASFPLNLQPHYKPLKLLGLFGFRNSRTDELRLRHAQSA